MASFKYIRRFSELGIDDVPLVGGKNASLGEMYQELSAEGVMVPNGFATTAEAYRYYIDHNSLHDSISGELEQLDINDVEQLARCGKSIRGWIMHGAMPVELAEEIHAAYQELSQEYGPYPDVAVRSSATA